MDKIPLQIRLKRETHRKIAYAQDLIVKEVYSVLKKLGICSTKVMRWEKSEKGCRSMGLYLRDDSKYGSAEWRGADHREIRSESGRGYVHGFGSGKTNRVSEYGH